MTWGIWQILTRALKNLKNFHFKGLLLTKVYNIWAKKSTEDLCLMVLNMDVKFERKMTCAFKNDMTWHISVEKQSTAFFFFFFFFTAHFLKSYQSILYFPMVSPWESFCQITVTFLAKHLCYLCSIFSINLHFTGTTFYVSSCEKFILKNNNRFWS